MEEEKILVDADSIDEFARELKRAPGVLPPRVNLEPDRVEQGLAKLLLTLIELIRRLMEKQAIRRIEGDSLTEGEIERIGVTLMKLEEKVKELKVVFGLENEDLNINLGPLGDLI